MDSNEAASLEPQRKMKRFPLEVQLTVIEPRGVLTDEASRYRSTEIVRYGLNQESFLSDPLSVFNSGTPKNQCI